MKKLITTLTAGAMLMPFSFGQDSEDDEVFELSPFTVDASENDGYRATSTLAGTRIRTDLKDIGTSVQVITKDFMNDIGADDASTLLNYTTSTEVGGIGGNYSGNDASDPNVSSEESRGNPQSSTRVRGLFRADLTRDYFKTIVPFDSYNTSSVDINRGSNATLFGLGSPAGIINNTLDAANYSNKGEIGLRFDSYGSARASLNVNRVLVEDKLAIRIAAVKDDRKYYQDPAFQDTERLFLSGKWNIRPNTLLKANYETGKTSANRPSGTSPIESITPWLLMGKRVLDTSLATGIGRDLNAPTGIKIDKDGDGILDDVYPGEISADRIYDYMQFGDGRFVNEGNWTWKTNDNKYPGGRINGGAVETFEGAEKNLTGGVGQPQIWGQASIIYDNVNSSTVTTGGFKAQYAGNENYAGDALTLSGDGNDFRPSFKGINNINGFYNNWNPQGFTSLNGFDWGKNMLSGKTADQGDEFETGNITFEQTFWDQNAGISLSYDKQRFDYEFYTPLQLGNSSQIKVDLNARLPDGRENPNLGRPYMISRNYRMFRNNEMETLRATGFVQHDFSEKSDGLMKILGRHSLTGLADRNTETREETRAFQVWDDEDLRRVLRVGDASKDLNNFSSRVFPFVYVGPSMLDYDVNSIDDVILTPPNMNLWNPGSTVPVTYWDPGTSAPGVAAKDKETVIAEGRLVTRDVKVGAAITEKTAYNETITESLAAVWQGYFLDNHLVTTIGYRKDAVENTLYSNPPIDEFHRHLIDSPLDDWDSELQEVTEDRWSYGAVAHIPGRFTEWLGTTASIHYSESSNFSLEPGRVNWNNEEIGNPGGETQEWGFSLSSNDNKFHVRVNWFETGLVGRTSSGAANLLWNPVLQRADSFLSEAVNNTDPVYAEFNRNVGLALLDNVTAGEAALYAPMLRYDENGTPIGLDYAAVKAPRETEDVVAKGMEIELTYNPTKNWRIHANIARQETVVSNVHPYTLAQYEQRELVLNSGVTGFEFKDIKELSTSHVTEEDWLVSKDGIYEKVNGDNTYKTIGEDFEERMTAYRTKKAAEGSVATEQREWRLNLITNYSFKEGALRGLSIGGAYRWQDEVAIGFPYIIDDDGNRVGDVSNPVYAPSEDNVDLMASYKMPFLEDLGKWTMRFQIRNVFAGEDDIIPVQLQGDGVTYSRYRLAPQREFVLSSSLAF